MISYEEVAKNENVTARSPRCLISDFPRCPSLAFTRYPLHRPKDSPRIQGPSPVLLFGTFHNRPGRKVASLLNALILIYSTWPSMTPIVVPTL